MQLHTKQKRAAPPLFFARPDIRRTFAYLFICLRQHGTFFFVLGDF
jgi:hypothetical protein